MNEAAAIILSGLIAMFATNLGDLDPPEVTIFEKTAFTKELGITDCGYVKYPSGEKKPFCRIKINECLLNNPRQLIDTYLHELAHYVDWMSDEKWEHHGGQWMRLVRRWDLVNHSKEAQEKIPGC